MCRGMAWCVVVGGVVASAPVVGGEWRDGLTVYHSNITPEGVYRIPGTPRVADRPAEPKPEAAPADEPPPIAEAPPPEGPYAAECPPSQCGKCRKGCKSCDRCKECECPSCYINDQYEPEWYVSPMLGFQDPHITSWDWGAQKFQIDPNGGIQGGLAFGWATGPTWCGRRRVEVEVMIRENDVDRLRTDNLPITVDGRLHTYSEMVNVLWDFKRPDCDWYPYLGGGIGCAQMSFDPNFNPWGSDNLRSQNLFAWQAIVGVSYRVKSYLEVFGEARQFGTGNPDFNTTGSGFTTPAGAVIPPGVRNLHGHFNTAGAMFGVRIILGKRRCADIPPSCDGRTVSGGGWHWTPNP